jgi:predicted nucleic acid-binding protein
VKSFVVDASVVVEFLVPGRHTEGADKVLGTLAAENPADLLAPDIILLEVANALRKIVARRLISPAEGGQAIADVSRLAIHRVESAALLEGVWSLRHRMSAYDASYVTLGALLDLPVISADRKLVVAARDAGVGAWALDDDELERVLGPTG